MREPPGESHPHLSGDAVFRALAPVRTTLLIVSGAVPLLVSVSVCVELAVPRAMEPKLIVPGP